MKKKDREMILGSNYGEIIWIQDNKRSWAESLKLLAQNGDPVNIHRDDAWVLSYLDK